MHKQLSVLWSSFLVSGCFLGSSLPLPTACIYDLIEKDYTCEHDAISFFPDRGELENGKGFLRIDMTDYSSVVFDLSYNEKPRGFSFHVGDSITNNGWGGDAASQSRDAEVYIHGTELMLFTSDHGLQRADGPYISDGKDNKIVSEALIYEQGEILSLTVADSYLGWSGMGSEGEMESDYIFALEGQEDYEGFENNNLFVSFNQTIADYEERTGSGLARVSIQLIP